MALTAEDLKRMTPEEILARIEASLEHDEAEWLASRRIPFSGRKQRAEHLETVLFQCASCGEVGRMRSREDSFRCEACGQVSRLDRYYRFQPAEGRPPRFSTIREWSLWQEEAFRDYLMQKVARDEGTPLFSDPGVLVLKGWRLSPLRRIRVGTLSLYRDRIELAPLAGRPLAFPLSEVEGEGVLKRNLLEFYRGRSVYQVRFPTRRSSARQWMMAISILRVPDRSGLGQGSAAG